MVLPQAKGMFEKRLVELGFLTFRKGLKTALVDANIFEASIPKMFGIENVNPQVTRLSDK